MKNTIPAAIAVMLCVAGLGLVALHSHGDPPANAAPAAIAEAPATPAGSGSAATIPTGVDEKKANELFHDDRGRAAKHTKDGKGLGDSWVIVANCEDGSKVWAPFALYVRARADTGGYTRRKTDPEPIVVPLSYDWCVYP